MAITRSQARINSKVRKTLELPMDLIFDILSRLPVKSLLRFKSVSKTFYNLIKNPNFIKQQLTHSKLNPNPAFSAILSTVFIREMGKQIFRVNLIDALDKPIDLDLPPFMPENTKFRVLGTCNGLVCIMLCNESSCIFICNPLIGEFRRVPNMNDQGCKIFSEYMDSVYIGFGLNGDNNYELFRIVYETDINDKLVLEGKAYSLTTDTWREIDVKKGDFDHNVGHIIHYMYIYLHGFFYWAIPVSDLDCIEVVSFDFKNEVLDGFLGPSIMKYCHAWMLRDLKEELALVIYHYHCSYDIWVLNGKDKSWTMKFKIEEARYRVSAVLGNVWIGKLADFNNYRTNVKLFLYDMDTDGIETLPYVNVGGNMEILYTESLVSVKVGDDVAEA